MDMRGVERGIVVRIQRSALGAEGERVRREGIGDGRVCDDGADFSSDEVRHCIVGGFVGHDVGVGRHEVHQPVAFLVALLPLIVGGFEHGFYQRVRHRDARHAIWCAHMGAPWAPVRPGCTLRLQAVSCRPPQRASGGTFFLLRQVKEKKMGIMIRDSVLCACTVN